MPSKQSLDHGKSYDWGRTSSDYANHRPGYPPEFFTILNSLGVGRRDQRILDLATGPGVLAVPFALQGAEVVALDIAENQIQTAREYARKAGVTLKFLVADGVSSGLPAASFDVVSASMCLHYFDRAEIIREIKRLLRPGGVLLAASLLYLPGRSEIAAASERLILEHNPDWTSGGYDGVVSSNPAWAKDEFRVKSFHRYVADIPFSREGWRGRIRACRGVGASLDPDQVESFDRAHAQMLEKLAEETFTIPHVVAFHVYEST